MKYHIVLRHSVLAMILVIFFGLTVSAQEKKLSPKQLPATVSSAFHKAYPAAKIKGASSEVENGKTMYEVESVDGKINRDLLYAVDGTCVEIEETIPTKAVPNEVLSSLKKEFPKGSIQKAEKLTKGEVIQYEFVLVSGKNRHEVVVDPTGKIFSNEVLKKREKAGEKED